VVVTAPHAVRRALPRSLPAGELWRSLRFPLAAFGVVALVLYAVAELSFTFLPRAVILPHGFPDYPGFDAWTRWDSDWYLHIARSGYYYNGPGQQSAVAFFPGYPAVVRAVMLVLRNDVVSGVLVTYLAGLAAVVMFFRWCGAAFGPRVARTAVLLLVLYPFAFYLFGAVYSDALFLAAALGAFLLLEYDHPWPAGAVGALAVACRPFGLVVAAGLALRALELRGVLAGAPGRLTADAEPIAARRTPLLPRRIVLRALDRRDAGVLVSVLGFAGFCALLGWRFGDPFAFRKVYSAEGWGKTWDAHTMLKVEFFRHFRVAPLDFSSIHLTAQAVITVIGLGLVPVVFRRLGWAYGVYTGLVLVIPALASREFLSMGRYALAAFPCFAVAGALLDDRRRVWLRSGWFAASTAGLVFMMSLYARWYFIS
jgi:Mannosyltransferase (PIG-V)